MALWRVNGMDIAATTPDALMTAGRQSVLAQVLTESSHQLRPGTLPAPPCGSRES